MRKIFLIIFIILSATGVKAQNSDLSYLFLNGVERFLLGDTKGAAELFTQSLKRDTSHAPSHFYMAKIAADDGQNDMAMDLIDKAISKDSANLDYMLFKAQIHLTAQQYAAAEQIFSTLLLKEHNPQYYIMNVALLLELNRVDDALKICNDFESKYGLNEQLSELKRMALLRSRNYFGAEEYMGLVAQTFPGSAEYLVAQAEINAALRRDSSAVALYRQAITLDSLNAGPHYALAEYYRKSDNVGGYIEALTPLFSIKQVPAAEKIEIFEKNFFVSGIYRDNYPSIRRLMSTLLMSEPDNLAIRMLYGRFLTYTGQIDEGLEQYKAIYDEGIVTEDLAERITEILLYQKKYAYARQVLDKAIIKYPKSVTLAQNSVVASWLAGDGKGAIKMAKQSLKRLGGSDSVQTLFHAIIGDIYHELGSDKQCFAAYKKALHYDPGNALALNNYAYFLALQGVDLEHALAMATRATELSTANATYLDTKAWVLFCMGQYEQAQQVQRSALGLDTSGAPEYMLHYGDILYALGDDFLARTYWKKALEAGADSAVIEQRMARPKAVKIN